VLFVHGWVLGADMWEYQMTPLAAQGLCCIAYDLRGAGRSDQPGHGYDPDSPTDDLAAVKVPALIVHGDSDAMIPFQVSARRTAGRSRTASSSCTSTPRTACSSPTDNA
jgi:pimeloyl-ACP methyl ester carboxylesterase